MYMLDTNMVNHVRYQNPRVIARLDVHRHETFVSGIVVEEIVILGFGAAMSTARSGKSNADIVRLYTDFLQTIEELAESKKLPYTQGSEAVFKTLKSGKGSAKVKGMDGHIAAHTLFLSMVLVTQNERDFENITNLAVENWTQ